MPKLFASDFDGTLNFHDGDVVRPADLAAIKAYQATGGLFGACTGRPLLGLEKEAQGAIPFDFYISATGATLHDAEQRLVWGASMDRAVIEEMVEAIGKPCCDSFGTLVVAADDYWLVGEGSLDWPIISYAPTFDDLPGPFIGWAMGTETLAEAEEAAAQVIARHGDVATAYVNLASIDVVPVGCSKGSGLRRAAEHFGATLTGGIGDSFNDLPLLEAADVAYTFRSAAPEVQAAADVLVDSVAEALEDFARR